MYIIVVSLKLRVDWIWWIKSTHLCLISGNFSGWALFRTKDHAAKYICTGDLVLTQNLYHNKSNCFSYNSLIPYITYTLFSLCVCSNTLRILSSAKWTEKSISLERQLLYSTIELRFRFLYSFKSILRKVLLRSLIDVLLNL